MNEFYFNVIYKDDNILIPEIDDDELLLFSITFMDIQKREYKTVKNKINKDERN